MSSTSSGRSFLRWQALAILVGIPAMLATLSFLTPEDMEAMPRLCLFRRVTDTPCPACGIGRALCCVMHGDLSRAWSFNRLIVALIPVLVWVWFEQVRIWRRKDSPPVEGPPPSAPAPL